MRPPGGPFRLRPGEKCPSFPPSPLVGGPGSTIPAVKKEDKLKGSTKASVWLALWLAMQKEVISKPKQPTCRKRVQPTKRQG